MLVGGLDDIVDTVDALAKRFPLYHVQAMEPIFQKQTDTLVEAAVRAERSGPPASQVAETLGTKRQADRNPSPGECRRRSEPFRHVQSLLGATDPLTVMKWKELYEMIEDAIDGCEDVETRWKELF